MDASLEGAGFAGGKGNVGAAADTAPPPMVLVRQVLVAEGWRIRQPQDEDTWSSTSEEEAYELYTSATAF